MRKIFSFFILITSYSCFSQKNQYIIDEYIGFCRQIPDIRNFHKFQKKLDSLIRPIQKTNYGIKLMDDSFINIAIPFQRKYFDSFFEIKKNTQVPDTFINAVKNLIYKMKKDTAFNLLFIDSNSFIINNNISIEVFISKFEKGYCYISCVFVPSFPLIRIRKVAIWNIGN